MQRHCQPQHENEITATNEKKKEENKQQTMVGAGSIDWIPRAWEAGSAEAFSLGVISISSFFQVASALSPTRVRHYLLTLLPLVWLNRSKIFHINTGYPVRCLQGPAWFNGRRLLALASRSRFKNCGSGLRVDSDQPQGQVVINISRQRHHHMNRGVGIISHGGGPCSVG